jgi:hypothetical protein
MTISLSFRALTIVRFTRRGSVEYTVAKRHGLFTWALSIAAARKTDHSRRGPWTSLALAKTQKWKMRLLKENELVAKAGDHCVISFIGRGV